MKSILNKLTVEKFPALSQQLVSCGIRTASHLETLIQEIFEKATTQHHFICMYVDLCSLLQDHFASSDPSMNLKKILLNACQASFERHLKPPVNLETLQGEERESAEQLYKMQMLGNIKLVGALLVRKMLANKVMFAIAGELINDPTPEALESLAALLTVIGPVFDRQEYPHRLMLTAIFDQVETLTRKSSVKTRIRCLLQDVLELRAARWEDRKPKKLEGPSTLEEVAQKFHAEAEVPLASKRGSKTEPTQGSLKVSGAKPLRTSRLASDLFQASGSKSGAAKLSDQPRKQNDKVCREEILGAFTELCSSHDVQEAAARIAAIVVPPSAQAEELCELLAHIVEQSSEGARKVGFKLLVALFVEGHWKPGACSKGFKSFASLCVDLKCDVPVLPKIISEELAPALEALVSGGMLSAEQVQALASEA
jgi:hypothetical protein